MQTLDVSLSIPIPSNMVLITRTHYEELKDEQLHGVYWSMKDLENRNGKNSSGLKKIGGESR